MPIPDARVREIALALASAGDEWPTVARRLPEFASLAKAVPPGPGMHRPWVLLNDAHEYLEMPMRLIQFENGSWFHKGQYLTDVQEARQWQ